jgi:hypothetical protein
MNQKNKDWKKEILPGLNGFLIACLLVYFYKADNTQIIFLVSVFFLLARTVGEKIVEYFVYKITPAAHWIIFSGLVILYLYVFIPVLLKLRAATIKGTK